MLSSLIELLHAEACSLVVLKNGHVSTYFKKGVRDLIWLIDNQPDNLHGAMVADKVVGKAAAGLMIVAQVAEVYADVMSKPAILLFEEQAIPYSYQQIVDAIEIPEGDTRCPLEQIVSKAHTAEEIEKLLRTHFIEMSINNKTEKIK